MDLENFATAGRWYKGDIHKSSVVGLFMTHLRQWKWLGCVMVECTLSITHCLRLNLQIHTIDLARTCRISSFCTVAWQLARFQVTIRIARSLGDSWASCFDLSGECCRGNQFRWRNRASIRTFDLSSRADREISAYGEKCNCCTLLGAPKRITRFDGRRPTNQLTN